jgi:hypothetical protein
MIYQWQDNADGTAGVGAFEGLVNSRIYNSLPSTRVSTFNDRGLFGGNRLVEILVVLKRGINIII